MTIFEKLSTLAEITDQDEMIKACKIIPDEELRLALVVLALAYNKNEQSNREIFHRQTQEVDSLKEKIKELEKASKQHCEIRHGKGVTQHGAAHVSGNRPQVVLRFRRMRRPPPRSTYHKSGRGGFLPH